MIITKRIALVFLNLIITANLFSQTGSADLSAEKIIEQSITAMGGREYLASIKTLYSEISTEMQGRKVVWVTKEMLPNKGAFQIVYETGVVFENWYDGTTGYEMVNGKKQLADPAEFKDKIYRKNIFNELDFLDKSLYTLELLGEEKVNKESCYKIKASLKNGAVKLLYFSKKTFLLMREDKSDNPEKDAFTSAYFLKYKKYGQLLFYSELKFGDNNQFQTGKVTTLLVNEGITEADFTK
ncbi:hypothetical protein [Lacibacter sp. H407]|uniref:hypothetical protein n=1 Tax=Lacibacter sp. H407 TaxID=3133423 RepID=UPI0030C023C5